MSRKLSDLHPKVRALAEKLLQVAEANGHRVIVTSTLRTFDEQASLYAQGRTMPGKIVTNAKPGDSFHNWGLAFDVAIIRDGRATWDAKVDVDDDRIPDYEEVGKLGESIGLEWGGRFHLVDMPHFQFTGGLTLRDLRLGKRLSV